jgi:hypothetical protein
LRLYNNTSHNDVEATLTIDSGNPVLTFDAAQGLFDSFWLYPWQPGARGKNGEWIAPTILRNPEPEPPEE